MYIFRSRTNNGDGYEIYGQNGYSRKLCKRCVFKFSFWINNNCDIYVYANSKRDFK